MLSLLLIFAILATASGQALPPQPGTVAVLQPSARLTDSTAGNSEREGVLLLRNGQTFSGLYRQIADQYTIVCSNGVTIRFASSQVEFAGDSIIELYTYQRAKRIRHNVPACLELVQWCMQNKLYNQASEELQHARTINAQNPAIRSLQIRLQLLISPPPDTAPNTNPSASLYPGPATPADVQQRIQQLPATSVQHFANTIQPLLLNHCAVAGCHGPSPTSDFVLFRTSARKAVPQRVTLRNLYNTLEQIDLQRPVNSSLLETATTAHGGQLQAALTVKQTDQIARLVDWVRIISTTHPVAQTENPPQLSARHSATWVFSQQTPIISQTYSSAMSTPGATGMPPQLNPPIATAAKGLETIHPTSPTLQQWLRTGDKYREQTALQNGIVLPVEMIDSHVGSMKIGSPKKTNLTPGMDHNFSLPSDRIFNQYKSLVPPRR